MSNIILYKLLVIIQNEPINQDTFCYGYSPPFLECLKTKELASIKHDDF